MSNDNWILCSERMPPTWTYVWVTARGQVEVCMLSHKGYWVDVIDQEYMFDLDNVVAWMDYYVPPPYGSDE